MDQRASARIAVATMASALESSGSYRSSCWISWVIAEAEAVIAAARVRLFGEAAS